MTTERTDASDSTAPFERKSSGFDVVALWGTTIEQPKSKTEDNVAALFGSLVLCGDGEDGEPLDDSDERPDTPPIGDGQQPSSPPKEIAESISTLQRSNNPVDKALAEALLKMFSQDRENVDTEKIQDAKLILELANRNEPPMDKAGLTAVLTKLEHLGHRHALLELFQSEKNPDAVKEIVGLLKSDDPKHNSAAELLVRCMISEEPAEKQLFTDMIKMLKEPTTRDDALTLLSAPFPFNTEHMSAMIDLKESGSAEQYTQIKELIKSGDTASACALLDLGSTNPELFDRTMTALAGAQRKDVLEIVNKFSNPEHVSRLLDLTDAPEKKPLLDTLLKSPESAKELLDLMGSALPADKTMADNLVKMLAGTEQERKDALHLLTIPDRAQRENAYKLLLNPVTAPGIRHLLQLRADAANDSTHRRRNHAYDNANAMLEYATSSTGKTESLTTFLTLLGGSDQERSFVTAAFRGRDVQSFNAIMTAVRSDSASPTDTVKALSRLMSTDHGSRAVELLMQVRRNDRELYGKAIDYLKVATPEDLTELSKSMSLLNDNQAVRRLLALRVDPTKQEFYKQVVRDLTSGSGTDAIAAGRLFLGISDPKEQPNAFRENGDDQRSTLDTATAADLERLYADPNTRELAKAVLTHASSPEDLSRLSKLFANDPNLANDVGKLLRQKPELAKAFLTQFKDPEQMTEFIKIYGTKATGTAAAVLCDMLRSDRNVGGLMSMLASKKPNEAALGNNLVAMLNTFRDEPLDPTRSNSWTERSDTPERSRARRLIGSGLSSDAIAMLKTTLESDPEDTSLDDSRHRAIRILELAERNPTIRPQLSEMVTNLGSNDPQKRQFGERVFDLLRKEPTLAKSILTRATGSTVPSLEAIFQIADNNSKLKAVKQLLDWRDSPSTPADLARPSISSAAILDLLANPATADGAKLVVDLLANPATQAKGSMLVDTLSMGRETGTKEMLRIMTAPKDDREKGLASVLTELVNSIDKPESRLALGNLSRLLGAKDKGGASFTLIADALLDPAQKDKALTALSRLSSDQSCRKFFQLMADPNFKPAVDFILERLKNGSSQDISRIEAAAFTSEGAKPPWIVHMLNDKATKELAESLIQLTSSDGLDRVQRLYADKQTRPLVVNLISKLKADPTLRPLVEQLLATASASEFKSIYPLLVPKPGSGQESEREKQVAEASRVKNRELARRVLALATSDENAENRMGRQMMRLMADAAPLSVDEAKSLLDRFQSDSDEQPYLLALIGFNAEELRRLEKRLTGPGNEHARAFFTEMFADPDTLEGNRQSSLPLFQALLALESTNRAEAAGIWRMINDPRYRQSARRALEGLLNKASK